MRHFFILTCFVLLTLTSCGQKENTSELKILASNIIGGTPVSATDPIREIVVAFQTTHELCSAVIISPQHILTAAHCLTKGTPKSIIFADGSIINDFLGFKTHPQFSNSVDNRFDFAVVKFNSSKKIKTTAKLSAPETDPKNGSIAFIAGFGVNSTKLTGHGVLRSLIISIKNFNFSHTEAEISESAGSGACHGDSGGPAYIIKNREIIIWGIDSLNSPRSSRNCYEFELYSKVSVVRDWILKTTLL